jgi:enoyl-CoA hydratase/carnithine racemase
MSYIKTKLSLFWNWLLNKTTIDEKIVDVVEDVQEVVQETKRRATRVKEEAADVVAAAKEVVKQSKDVVDAASGNKRRGRKPANKNRKSQEK